MFIVTQIQVSASGPLVYTCDLLNHSMTVSTLVPRVI